MACDGEALEAEGGHGLELVDGHHSLAVRGVVGRRRGAKRCAVAGQIRSDDGVVIGEQRRRGMPHQMGLRITVQQ